MANSFDNSNAISNASGLYPVIKTDKEVQQMINSTINDKNAKAVKSAIEAKNLKLKHYLKVRNNWAKWKKYSTIGFLIIGIIMQLASLTIGYLIDSNILQNSYATEVIDTISVVILLPLAVIITKAFDKKIETYDDISSKVEKTINKVYIYWRQAEKDNLITDDELTKFNEIFTETESQVHLGESAPILESGVLTELESVFTQGIAAIKKLK